MKILHKKADANRIGFFRELTIPNVTMCFHTSYYTALRIESIPKY